NPLSQWLNNRLDGPPLFGEDKTRGYKYSLERLDRQEFIVSCAKYLGNQAFIELLIYDITREPSYLQLCQNNNVLALDAEADGWGNIHFSDYKIQPGAADMYCHSHHYDSEMQIGLTRTSCYQLAAASVMGDQGDFQFIIERLSKLLDKDDSESTNVRNVINSALTAKRNLTECGMGHLWDGLEQVLPEQLKQRLSR
ncbi:MAG: hypothetical protein HW403_1396, partial [Dehalococcoidia bacterium]|nr:hypothetical protein [Dehalococcoidia bacterium]